MAVFGPAKPISASDRNCLIVAMVMLLVSFFFAPEFHFLFCLLILISPSEIKALGIADLFLRKDEQGHAALLRGDPKKAAQLFEDDLRKGGAYYRAKEYDKAIEHFSQVASSDGFYNLGNALAQIGKISDAIKAYEQALSLDKSNHDAKANKELLEKLLKDQRQNPDQQGQQDQQEQPDQPQEHSDEEKNSQDNQQGDRGEKDTNNSSPKQEDATKDQPGTQPGDTKESGKKDADKKASASQSLEDKNDQTNEQKAMPAKPEGNAALDPDTIHHLQQVDGPAKTSNYLKRKLAQESRRERDAK
jgi:Ca-activated chloride channel family protein